MNITKDIKNLIDCGQITIVELAKILDVSRPTIYKRLKDSKWNKLQVLALSKLI